MKTKKVDAWMPLLIDKYLGDTTHLTTEQHGAYLLLLMAMWKRDGSLPASDQQLAAIARMPASKWRAAKSVLMEFFTERTDGAGITQKRLADELVRAKEHSNSKAKAGAKGAASRWQKDDTAIGESDGTAMADASQNPWQTDAPIPIPLTQDQSGEGVGSTSAPEVDTEGHSPTAAGLACRAMRQAGMPDVNPGDPRLLSLLEQGATQAELASVAAEGAKRGKGFAWALATLVGRRSDAAAIALAPPPPATVASAEPVKTAALLADMAQRAADASTPESQQARRSALAKLGRAAA